jgi:hypothetical protein
MTNSGLQYIKNNIPNYDLFGYNKNLRVNPTHLTGTFMPVRFERYATDIAMWKEAIEEAERVMLPHRVRMQRMYNDTTISPIVKPYLDARVDLTLLRDFAMYKMQGGKKVYSTDLAQQLEAQSWFSVYLGYLAESPAFGYNLIQLGELINDGFPNLTITPREHINPDGVNSYNNTKGAILTTYVYALDGIALQSGQDGFKKVDDNDPLIPLFNHYVTTPSENGYSACGMGWLYTVAAAEIHLRHSIEWQMDFTEIFGMPLRVGSTTKTGDEKTRFQNFLTNLGAGGAALIDPNTDKIEFIQQQQAGTAWKTYSTVNEYLEGIIAQNVLGHTDAIKSLPGKLGGMQAANKDGFNVSMVEQAIFNKQTIDGNFVKSFINNHTAQKIRTIGKMFGSRLLKDLFPPGYYFEQKNDREEQELMRRTNSQNLLASQWIEKMAKAGFDVDAGQISSHMGFNINKNQPKNTEPPKPTIPNE